MLATVTERLNDKDLYKFRQWIRSLTPFFHIFASYLSNSCVSVRPPNRKVHFGRYKKVFALKTGTDGQTKMVPRRRLDNETKTYGAAPIAQRGRRYHSKISTGYRPRRTESISEFFVVFHCLRQKRVAVTVRCVALQRRDVTAWIFLGGIHSVVDQ